MSTHRHPSPEPSAPPPGVPAVAWVGDDCAPVLLSADEGFRLRQQQSALATLGYHVFYKPRGDSDLQYTLHTITSHRRFAVRLKHEIERGDFTAKVVRAPRVMPGSGS